MSINHLIDQIGLNLKKEVKVNQMPPHKADMKTTWADISKAKLLLDWEPKVTLQNGIQKNSLNKLKTMKIYKKYD